MNTSSMYHAVMGEAFNRLAVPVRQFHTFAGRHEFVGEVQVSAPVSLPARLIAILLGAPLEAAQGRIRFQLLAEPGVETWTRYFPGRTMRSTLTKAGDRVVERLGVSRLSFELLEVDGALEMRLEKLHFLGIPCPGWLMPTVMACETGGAQKLQFQVRASVPLVGMVAGYVGYLHMPGEPVR